MISLKEIEKLATLSRLALSAQEKEDVRKSMDSILGYVEQVQKVSGKGASEKVAGVLRNVMREDVVTNDGGMYTDKIIAQFPDSDHGYLKVKQIL